MNRDQRRKQAFPSLAEKRNDMRTWYDQIVNVALKYGDNCIIDNLVEYIPWVSPNPQNEGIVAKHQKLREYRNTVFAEYAEAFNDPVA